MEPPFTTAFPSPAVYQLSVADPFDGVMEVMDNHLLVALHVVSCTNAAPKWSN